MNKIYKLFGEPILDIFNKPFNKCIDIKKYSIYILFISLLYPIFYLFMRKYDYEHEKKSSLKHYEGYRQMFVYSTLLYIFGNYDNNYNFISYIFTTLTVFLFSIITELPQLKFSLASYKNWNAQRWGIIGSIFTIILFAIIYGIYESIEKNNIYPLIISPIIFVLFMKVIIGIVNDYNKNMELKLSGKLDDPLIARQYKYETEIREVHLHHWQFGIPLAFMFQNDTIFSSIARGIFNGVFLHGIITYNADDIIDIA